MFVLLQLKRGGVAKAKCEREKEKECTTRTQHVRLRLKHDSNRAFARANVWDFLRQVAKAWCNGMWHALKRIIVLDRVTKLSRLRVKKTNKVNVIKNKHIKR